MATIEEIEDLSVEIINGVDNEEDEPKEVKESASSPVRAEDADAAALVLSSAQEVQDLDSDEDDDEVTFAICSVFFPFIYLTSLFY